MPSRNHTKLAQKIGEFIKPYYEKKGVSAYELAKKNLITEPGIKFVIEGADMRVSTLLIMADLLDIPTEEIANFIDQNRKQSCIS